jgi:8-oxo-dGTP pyrophosphatase MutT (NUDIX family)
MKYLIPRRFQPRFYGAYSLITCGDEVLMVRNRLGSGRWALSGGGIEHHEQPEPAMRRELREELKIEVGAARALGFFPGHNHLSRPGYYLFAAEATDKLFVRDHFELRDARWFKLTDLPERQHEMIAEALSAMDKKIA